MERFVVVYVCLGDVPQLAWVRDSGQKGKADVKGGIPVVVASLPVVLKQAVSMYTLLDSKGTEKEKEAPYIVVMGCVKGTGPLARAGYGEKIPNKTIRRENIPVGENVRFFDFSDRIRGRRGPKRKNAHDGGWYISCGSSR
ncbi:MAG TPA: hypothetical protein VIV61_13000 [Candidatus Ozemobacteraceae bacterium]